MKNSPGTSSANETPWLEIETSRGCGQVTAIDGSTGRRGAARSSYSDPQVQQSIRDMLRNRKEQLLRTAYMIEARDDVKVTNYLARQILESSGKLPAAK